MTKEVRRAIVQHAVRWSQNILVEVSGNHTVALSHHERFLLIKVINTLAELQSYLSGDEKSP